jgi:hypothetical protein
MLRQAMIVNRPEPYPASFLSRVGRILIASAAQSEKMQLSPALQSPPRQAISQILFASLGFLWTNLA